MPDFILRQVILISMPVLAKLLDGYLTQNAKVQVVGWMRTLDKTTATVFDDIAVEALAKAWGIA